MACLNQPVRQCIQSTHTPCTHPLRTNATIAPYPTSPLHVCLLPGLHADPSDPMRITDDTRALGVVVSGVCCCSYLFSACRRGQYTPRPGCSFVLMLMLNTLLKGVEHQHQHKVAGLLPMGHSLGCEHTPAAAAAGTV